MRSRSALVALALALLATFVAACGDDDDDTATPDETTTESTEEETTTTTTEPEPEPITIVVTNDDGIGSEGIDVLVDALTGLEGVEVELVAPAENQSGSSDTTTEGGEVAYDDGATTGGFEGTAVEGFPADAVNVALQDLDIEADLVVSGINDGQNIGDVAALSGTVGAARTAARQGVPAVAVSAGFGDLADYETSAEFVVDWIGENRDAIVDGSLTTDTIVSFNIPSCTAGQTRELLEVELGGAIPEGAPFLDGIDCTTEPPAEAPMDDVTALFSGYASQTTVPLDL